MKERGWTLDVLNIVRRICETKSLECGDTSPLSPAATCRVIPKRGHARALQTEFTTADAYAFTRELEALHPDNGHVHDNPVNKHGAGIRQQLQVLRDMGFLLHVERGLWRLP